MSSAANVTHAASPETAAVRRRRGGTGVGEKAKPAVPRLAARKPTAAQQLTQVFGKLRHLLLTEWPSIRSMNLGVKSGTGFIDQLLSAQLSQLCVQLHMLVVSDAEAAQTLVKLVSKLDEQHFQQLQVLLDACGHEELSDYLRLLVSDVGQHSSRGQHTGKAAGSPRGKTTVTASRGESMRNGESLSPTADSTWQARNRATAGLFDLDSVDPLAPSRRTTNMSNSSQQDLKGLRFAGLLPPGHILTKTAEDLQRKHQFQEALQASRPNSTAGGASRKAQQQKHNQPQQAVPLLHLPPAKQAMSRQGDVFDESRLAGYQSVSGFPSTSGAGVLLSALRRSSDSFPGTHQQPNGPPTLWSPDQNGQSSWDGTGAQDWGVERPGSGGMIGAGCFDERCRAEALWRPLFAAPMKSIEQIWKEGRKATTEAILTGAHLEVHQSPLDTLLLEPPMLLQPRVQQPTAPAHSTSGKSISKGSNCSRPTSAATGSRPASRLAMIGARDVSFLGTSTAGTGGNLAGFGSVFSSTAGDSAPPDAGRDLQGLQLRGASSAGRGGSRRVAVVIGTDSNAAAATSDADSVPSAATNSSLGAGWGSSKGRSSHVAPAAGGSALGGTSPTSSVEMSAFPSSTFATASISRNSSVVRSPASEDSSTGSGAQGTKLGAKQNAGFGVGRGGVGGVQLRPGSAGSDHSRPGSAASASRLRASTRNELL